MGIVVCSSIEKKNDVFLRKRCIHRRLFLFLRLLRRLGVLWCGSIASFSFKSFFRRPTKRIRKPEDTRRGRFGFEDKFFIFVSPHRVALRNSVDKASEKSSTDYERWLRGESVRWFGNILPLMRRVCTRQAHRLCKWNENAPWPHSAGARSEPEGIAAAQIAPLHRARSSSFHENKRSFSSHTRNTQHIFFTKRKMLCCCCWLRSAVGARREFHLNACERRAHTSTPSACVCGESDRETRAAMSMKEFRARRNGWPARECGDVSRAEYVCDIPFDWYIQSPIKHFTRISLSLHDGNISGSIGRRGEGIRS